MFFKILVKKEKKGDSNEDQWAFDLVQLEEEMSLIINIFF
jgi:hypothetical protein